MRRTYLRSRDRDGERYLEALDEARENVRLAQRDYHEALDDAQSDEDRTGQAMIDRVESRFQELLSEHTIHEKALVVASVMRLELRDRWNDLQTRRAN